MSFGKRTEKRDMRQSSSSAVEGPEDDNGLPLLRALVLSGGVLLVLGLLFAGASLLGAITLPTGFGREFASRAELCSRGWEAGFPNGPQLRCYLTTDLPRLCDPRERRHLAGVLERYAADSTTYIMHVAAGIWKQEPDPVWEAKEAKRRAEGRPPAPGEAGPNPFAYMTEDWASSEQVRKLGSRFVKGAKDRLPRKELLRAFEFMLSRGYMTREDFGPLNNAVFGDVLGEAANSVKTTWPACKAPA